jgi:hypothetical protein
MAAGRCWPLEEGEEAELMLRTLQSAACLEKAGMMSVRVEAPIRFGLESRAANRAAIVGFAPTVHPIAVLLSHIFANSCLAPKMAHFRLSLVLAAANGVNALDASRGDGLTD